MLKVHTKIFSVKVCTYYQRYSTLIYVSLMIMGDFKFRVGAGVGAGVSAGASLGVCVSPSKI